jgi:hypothetical protein
MDPTLDATGGTLDLGMTVVTDDDHIVIHGMVLFDHAMNTCHQGAGGVDCAQTERDGLFFDCPRYAMGTENTHLSPGDLVKMLDEDRSDRLQLGNNMFVVDNLV